MQPEKFATPVLATIAALLLLMSGLAVYDSAHAATQDVWSVSGYKGTSKVGDYTGATHDAAYQACHDAVGKLTTTGKPTCKNEVLTWTVIPDPVTPPPTPAITLQFTTSVGGTYAPLNGATISTPINVRLSSQAPALSPCVFSLDGTDHNTEYGAPYDIEGDDILVTYTSGSHTIMAKCVGATVSATFTVTAPPVLPPPSGGSGSATLSWIWTAQQPAPPDLAGYHIRYGKAFDGAVCQQGKMDQSDQVTDPAATSKVITNLTPGGWCFSISAYTSTGAESDPSNVVSKTL